MKKIILFFMSLIGEKFRHKMYRRMASIPSEYLNSDFTIEIAKTQADLEAAYALLHDCYVGIKIIDPQPSGLRCYLYSFLPVSTIIVAKFRGKVIGTVSAIKDSKAGLPSDKDFSVQNNKFRRKEKTIIEASALAVAPEFRGNHSVSFLLMKHLYFYCKNCFQGDFMIAAVHPRAEDFYKALWRFERNGDPIEYKSLKGAAAIHISLDLSDEHLLKIKNDYTSQNLLKNIPALMEAEDARFRFPVQKAGQSIHPVLTPGMLKYFCLQKKEVWARMSRDERATIIQVYTTYFGDHAMVEFKADVDWNSRQLEYRTPIRFTSSVQIEAEDSISEIHDLTMGGCYVSWKSQMPSIGQSVAIGFRFEGKYYRLDGEVAWVNDGLSLHRQRGFGVRFGKCISGLNFRLQQWLYEAALSEAQPAQKLAA
jgi:Tfp pilus assembly protein PilZ